MEFKREERYIVFKVADLGNSLKGDEIRKLAQEYAEHRKQRGKEPLECVVVEKGWPEYEPTWQAIEARVTGVQAQPAPSFADAYQGAMEEVAIWKKRALEAEELNRKFVAEINGPVYMGEPVQPAPSVPTGWELVPVEVVALYRFMCSTFVPMTPQQKEIAKQFDLAKRAMAAAPEAKP